VFFWSNSGPFGPSRDRRSSRDSVRTGSLKDQRPPTSSCVRYESHRQSETAATPRNAATTSISTQVEVAQKENKVEQKLKQVEQFWSVAVLELARHKDTEVQVIVSPDDLIETLDEHNIQLQSTYSRVATVPSRHRCDSSPSEKAMGGLWSKFGPIRTAFDGRRSAQAWRPWGAPWTSSGVTYKRGRSVWVRLKLS
jgi:hypothetical protein